MTDNIYQGLEVKNLSKRFDGSDVLKDISFSVAKGTTLSIIGSSGSGKTTLLRCLNGLETPDGGTITVNGETVFDASLGGGSAGTDRAGRLYFGMVFQSFNLFPQYTALQNVTLAAELRDRKSTPDEIRARGMALLDSVGLGAKADLRPHQLSGGQQQRAAIARALMLEPDVLCFDEPTSALDPELTGEVLRVIKELAEKHVTMIIVTHEIEFARRVSDNVLFMDNGVVAEYGTAEQVIGSPANERTRRFLEGYSGMRA